jgi:hypothetical protein
MNPEVAATLRTAGWTPGRRVDVEPWRRIGRQLYPVGELDRGRFFLGIDARTEIYLVEAWVATYGPMPQALENLVLGVKATTIA